MKENKLRTSALFIARANICATKSARVDVRVPASERQHLNASTVSLGMHVRARTCVARVCGFKQTSVELNHILRALGVLCAGAQIPGLTSALPAQ